MLYLSATLPSMYKINLRCESGIHLFGTVVTALLLSSSSSPTETSILFLHFIFLLQTDIYKTSHIFRKIKVSEEF